MKSRQKKSKQTKYSKKMLSFALSVSLIAGCLGGAVIKDNTIIKANAEQVTLHSPAKDADGNTVWDCVWFGHYWQNDTNGDGTADTSDDKEEIKWRVLSVEGDTAFLLADKNLDCKPYNETYTDVTWENCTIRSWLNGYSGADNVCETDYGSDNFIDAAFTASEQAAIQTTKVINDDNPYYGTEGGNDTYDKVYLLSIAEAGNEGYGFLSDLRSSSEARKSKNTGFVANYSNMYSEGSYDDWWLRSPGCDSSSASGVYDGGWGDYHSYAVHFSGCVVRPALRLNLSSLASSLSYAGTVCSNGTADEEESGGTVSGGEGTGSKNEASAIGADKTNGCLTMPENLSIAEDGIAWLDVKIKCESYSVLCEMIDSIKVASADENTVSASIGLGAIHPSDTSTTEYSYGLYIKGMKVGETNVTVTAGDGSKLMCHVTVREKEKESEGESVNKVPAIKDNSYGVQIYQNTKKGAVMGAAWNFRNAEENYLKELKKQFEVDYRSVLHSSNAGYKELKEFDQKQKQPLLSLQTATEAQVEDAYEVLYEFLKSVLEEAAKGNYGFKLDDIDWSENNTMISIKIVNKVMDAVKDGNVYITGKGSNGNMVELYTIGMWPMQAGKVTVYDGKKYGSSTGTFCISGKYISAAINNFIEDMSSAVKEEMKSATLSLWKDFMKKTGFADIEKEWLESKFSEKAAYLKQQGYGNITNMVERIYNGYDAVKEVTSIKSTDKLTQALSLESLEGMYDKVKKLDYTDNEISREAVKEAVSAVQKCREELESALFDYLYDNDSKTLSPLDKIKHSRLLSYHCPVDIEVYDGKGNIIGSVINGVVTYDDSIYIELDGDVKTVVYPEGSDIKIKMIGTDSGSMDYVMEYYDNGVAMGRMNYYNIPLKKDIVYTQELTDAAFSTECDAYPVLQEDGSKIMANEFIKASSKEANVKIEWSGEEGGAVTGRDLLGKSNEKYAKGDTVKLLAQPDEGYYFNGWYEDGNLVSNESLYQFTATEDRNLTVDFVKQRIQPKQYSITVSEAYKDSLGVQLYENEDGTLDAVMSMYDIEDAEEASESLSLTVDKISDKAKIISSEFVSAQFNGLYHYQISNLSTGKWKELAVKNDSNTLFKIDNTSIPAHQHIFEKAWKLDTKGHWKLCECGEKSEQANHIYKEIVDKVATVKEAGSKHQECRICGYKKAAVSIPKLQGNEGSVKTAESISNLQDNDDSKTSLLKKGTIRTDSKTKSKIKITKSGTLKNGKVNGAEAQYIESATSKANITIPASVTIDGVNYSITSIKEGAFKNNKKLKKVVVGKNIKKIGRKAFYGCKNLKSIVVKSKHIKSIGKNAFNKIHKKAVIKVPAGKKSKYKKLLKKSGYKKTVR